MNEAVKNVLVEWNINRKVHFLIPKWFSS
jgi:hypothetical protein